MIPVPRTLQRLADEIDGWLDLRCPERAIELLGPVLADPEGRGVGLTMRVRANVRLGQYADALADLAELRQSYAELEWIELTEAWCRKRTADLPGAVRCMERLLVRNPRSGIGHFNLGCYLALGGDLDRAIDEVTLACGLDAEFRNLARDETDLDGLRADGRFRQLLQVRGADADDGHGSSEHEHDHDCDGSCGGPDPDLN